ncbi:unnamed protein product [Rotaria magnacalcarata]|uniref:Uncharacterized protein n=3 Tax=Rotaria magnacalcarata TaxID=392030 RepID=A0A816WTS7_9BILA|nr:unnamed protein product [Rotaria magnacalcarata]CAF1604507.1 unnamed protein product [Rotaria magnacalcarata]CAF2138538.1 unnamed protein product [Rotaria magnacalcarata]CAF5030131.1 unnamed protein product [Rotaria magnacalcarata]
MLSQQRRSPESSVGSKRSESVAAESKRSESVAAGSKRSESVATGSINNKNEKQSEPSESSDEESIKSVPPRPPPIQTPHSKTTKSPSLSKSSSDTSTPKPFRTIPNLVRKPTPNTFHAPIPKSKSPPEKGKTIQDLVKNAQLHSTPKKSTTTYGQLSAIDIENEQAHLIPITNSRNGKKNLSIFEKIDTHSGHSSYLGTGSYSQLVNCISSCLSQDRHDRNLTNHTTKSEYSSKSSKRASVLEDYSYDGITSPNHHVAHRKKSAAELSLTEIRQVNDALAKYGIPVFSHQSNPYSPHHPQRNIGDILSACRLLVENPNLAPNPNGRVAVQHVWESIRHHLPIQTAPDYASPVASAVSSHIFPGSQAPYRPAQSVATHLFPGQQQHSTGSPFSNAFHQYPGNNNFTY